MYFQWEGSELDSAHRYLFGESRPYDFGTACRGVFIANLTSPAKVGPCHSILSARHKIWW